MICKYNNSYFNYLNENVIEFNVDYLNNPSMFLNSYVYILDDEPVGFISYSIIFDRIELEYLWVKAEYRKNGIASSLIDFMLDEKNITNITLEVRVSNVNAINLYKKKGFTICTVRKQYYKNEDAYLMIREMM